MRPVYDTKPSDGLASDNAGALGNLEYPFIAIAPRSTLTRSDSTWKSRINLSTEGKQMTVIKLNW